MSNDPASLKAWITLTGLDRTEAAVVLGALPPGATATFDVTQPALGGARVRASIEGLSVAAVHSICDAVIGHHAQINSDDSFGSERVGEDR